MTGREMYLLYENGLAILHVSQQHFLFLSLTLPSHLCVRNYISGMSKRPVGHFLISCVSHGSVAANSTQSWQSLEVCRTHSFFPLPECWAHKQWSRTAPTQASKMQTMCGIRSSANWHAKRITSRLQQHTEDTLQSFYGLILLQRRFGYLEISVES